MSVDPHIYLQLAPMELSIRDSKSSEWFASSEGGKHTVVFDQGRVERDRYCTSVSTIISFQLGNDAAYGDCGGPP